MRKRIYINFLILIFSSIMILSILTGICFYQIFIQREIASVKESAYLIADFLNKNEDEEYYDYISGGADTLRITLIAPDGKVMLDNKTQAGDLENHSEREEIIEATQAGAGQSRRFSTTLMEETYYFAIKLNNGNILRLSKIVSSIAGVFLSSLPAVIMVSIFTLIFANMFARRLTKNIICPISQIDFDSKESIIYDELLPYVKRIQAQKLELDEKIKTLEERSNTIEAITKNMKEGLLLIDKSGVTVLNNKSASDIFDEPNMVQKDILCICREIEFQQKIKECLSGIYGTIQMKRETRIYDVFFNPVSSGEEINGAVILFFDITEKYEAEKQRREFSANVSHELKTPLTTISALAEMIGNGMAKEEDIKMFADKMLVQIDRLIRIISDIIKLSEFDENIKNDELTIFNLYELSQLVIEGLIAKANEKNIKINMIGKTLWLTANKQMMDELLYNLIDNAIKYNKENGIISVSLEEKDTMVEIAVSDTGIGIPYEHQERVFERFYRVDKSRSKKTGGTGLGLSIVKHIAEYHKGRVEIKSEVDVGTTVRCYVGK